MACYPLALIMKIPTERDGIWIDDMGACKVCDGEIPSGHDDNCDIFKLEKQARDQMDTIRNLEAENGRLHTRVEELDERLAAADSRYREVLDHQGSG